MRADAVRNVEKLRTAAMEIFREQGLHVPLREIASRAGVSHGTLYNLFGSRETLINEVVTGLTADRLEQIAAQSWAITDPWEGFAHYVTTMCEIQVSEPALADVLNGRYPEAETLMELCVRAGDDSMKIIDRAQRSGQLRADFTGEDLALTIGAIAALAQAGAKPAPSAWKRSMVFVLDGLRSDGSNSDLPLSSLAPEQVYAILSNLHGTR